MFVFYSSQIIKLRPKILFNERKHKTIMQQEGKFKTKSGSKYLYLIRKKRSICFNIYEYEI